MLINEKELLSSVKHLGANKTTENLLEALRKKELKPEDFSIRQLFEHLVVDERGESCGSQAISEMSRQGFKGRLSENLANFVASSTFSNIIGQIFYNAILESYTNAPYDVAPLFGVVQSNVISQSEKFAGISNLGDIASQVIPEAQEIPMASLSEDWINAPQQQKKGVRLPLTREALISDRTGLLLEHCRSVGNAAILAREIEACDAIINADGASSRVPYSWRGTNYAIYQSSASASPYYDNLTASNTLINQTSIDACYKTLAAITDPLTGQPIADQGRYTLLVTPENRYTAMQILHSEQVWNLPVGSFTNVSGGSSVVPFDVVVSKYLASRLTAASQPTTTYYFGDFSRAFKFVRSLDIVVEEANPMSGIAFSNDILMQFRVLKFETAACFQPRVLTKATVA